MVLYWWPTYHGITGHFTVEPELTAETAGQVGLGMAGGYKLIAEWTQKTQIPVSGFGGKIQDLVIRSLIKISFRSLRPVTRMKQGFTFAFCTKGSKFINRGIRRKH